MATANHEAPVKQEAPAKQSTPATTAVQMRFLPKTLDRVKQLVESTGITNRTQLVAACIEIAEIFITATKAGGKVYIEKEDGTREHIKIVGI